MLDIQLMILSQKVIALKRFIEDSNSPWKGVLETFLGDNARNLFYAVISIPVNFLFIYRTSTKSVSMHGEM